MTDHNEDLAQGLTKEERELHEQNIKLHKLNQHVSRELAGSMERLTDRMISIIRAQKKDIESLQFRVEYLEKQDRKRRESERLKVVH